MKKRELFTRVMKYHIQQKGITFFLGIIFVLGAYLGTRGYSLCGEEEQSLLLALLQPQNRTFSEMIRSQLMHECSLLLFLFLSGFCALGQTIAACMLLFRGLGLGISGAFLAQNGGESFQQYLTMMLPQTLILFLIQIIASKETISFSMNFLKHLMGNSTPRGSHITPRVYIVRYLLLLVLSVITVLLTTIFILMMNRLL